MANEMMAGVSYLRIEAQYEDELTAQFDTEFEQVRLKIDDGEGDMAVFLEPADARALAYFILGQVGN